MVFVVTSSCSNIVRISSQRARDGVCVANIGAKRDACMLFV
jgi:hypothetical protein